MSTTESYEKTSVSDISLITEQRVFKPFRTAVKINTQDDPIISFRSRKEHFNMTNVEIDEKENYLLDSKVITQEICSKIGKTKPVRQEKKIDENSIIRKVFSANKEFCMEKEVLLSPKIDKNLNNDVILEDDEEESSKRCDENNEENNIFCNFKKKLDESSDSKRRPSSQTPTKKSNKKTIGNIVATFSKIDQGNGVFVTNEDLIFVLPIMTVPKNVNVGNTYTFSISEHNKYQTRLSNIHETIQKRYIKQIK